MHGIIVDVQSMRQMFLAFSLVLCAVGQGLGQGKRVVLVAGDEEYRSEEALPQLAKILSVRHGFECTVLFAVDPQTGIIDPNQQQNIPGLEALAAADLLILFTRFRDLPDDQMKHIVSYVESGRPVIAIRTATHAFHFRVNKTYQRYSYNSTEWDGGFGRQALGETWVAHHGQHGKQGTRALIVKPRESHPILRGIRDGAIWSRTDVYRVRLPLPGDSQPLLLGQVLSGMQPTDPPESGAVNDPMMPVAWTRTYKGARVFVTTVGSGQDLLNESYRRLLINASYWAMGMEDRISAQANVDLVGDYQPLPFGMNGFRKGVKPSDLVAPLPMRP